MFSSRVPCELEPNRLTQAVRTARAAGGALYDLTITNPTAAGIIYPPSILDPLANPAARSYAPQPFGLMAAREAVAGDYARRGITVAPERVVLTASTSEAYSLLFKLLCAPQGDSVMVPVPSYPLFDHLTRLDGVRSIPYRLDYHGRWTVDVDSVDSGWDASVRAVLAVSPNNPTGSLLSAAELHGLSARCAERDAALIVDEVFADYGLGTELVPLKADTTAVGPKADATGVRPDVVSGFSRTTCLTFHLGGLSKSAGLPQVKLGWIAVDGPDRQVAEALERLELICDTYLSVSTPVQIAAPALIESGTLVREQIVQRVRTNYAALRALAAAYPSTDLLNAEAGWSAVVRVPSTRSEEALALDLIEHDRVVVHPGFFFDFAHEAFLVVSLLPEPPIFLEGVRRMLERVRV